MADGPIAVHQLPMKLQRAAWSLAELVEETAGDGPFRSGPVELSVSDLVQAAALQKKVTRGRATTVEEDRANTACRAFRRLRTLLNLRPSDRCNFLGDGKIVLARLRTMVRLNTLSSAPLQAITLSKKWSVLDRFAALEYAGRVFHTFIERSADAWSAQSSSLRITRQHGSATIHANIRKEPIAPVQSVEIRMATKRLQSGKEVTDTFDIIVGGRRLAPKAYVELLPDLLSATGTWAYAECGWNLLDEGLILFNFNQSGLTEGAKIYLTLLVGGLRQIAMDEENHWPTIALTGHADSVGQSVRNAALGRDRSRAVQQFLEERGVPSDVITVDTEGEAQPVDAKGDEQKNSYNRNVQIRVRPVAEDLKSSCYKYYAPSGVSHGTSFYVSECEIYPSHCTNPMLDSSPVVR